MEMKIKQAEKDHKEGKMDSVLPSNEIKDE